MTSKPQTTVTQTQTDLAGQADESAAWTGKKHRPVLTRDELADELLRCCDDGIALSAHQAAVESIRRGDDSDKVLSLMDYDNYPAIYLFVYIENMRIEWAS
jgi:hypothetical protein